MVQKVDSIIKLNLKTILEKVEERYGLKLSRKIIMVDYDEKLRSLFIKFKHSDIIDGKPTSDGLTIFHYGKGDELIAIEILDITKIQQQTF